MRALWQTNGLAPKQRRDKTEPIYLCQRDGIDDARPIFASILGGDLDARIGELLLEPLSPLAVEAALTVSAELEQRSADADRIRAAHVERARYRADLPQRRYLASTYRRTSCVHPAARGDRPQPGLGTRTARPEPDPQHFTNLVHTDLPNAMPEFERATRRPPDATRRVVP